MSTKSKILIHENEVLAKDPNILPDNCHFDKSLESVIFINGKKMAHNCVVFGHGNITAVLVGNSYAEKISRGVLRALGNRTNSLHVVFKPYCSIIPGLGGPECELFESIAVNSVKELKPDILFISSKFRLFPLMNEPVSRDPMNPDNATALIQEALEEYSKYTDHIVIIEPQAVFNHGIAYHLAKALAGYEDIQDLSYSTGYVHKSQEPLLARLDLIDCPKCVRVDVQDEFCSNKTGICETFDPVSKLAYFGDNHHFTKYGVEKVWHKIQEAVDKIQKLENSK